jgi:hypothetical protein
MTRTLTLFLTLIFLTAAFAGCTNAPGQSHGIVGRWEREIEIGESRFTYVWIEFFDNGIVISGRRDEPGGDAFLWELKDGLLYIYDLTNPIRLSLGSPYEDEEEQPPLEREPQIISFDITDDRLTINWSTVGRGSFSGGYTRKQTSPPDSTGNHFLLGTWEFPPERRSNEYGLWDIEALTFFPNGTGITAEVTVGTERQERDFLWMARGNQLIYISGGWVQILEFRPAENRLYFSMGDEEIAITKRE